MVYCLRVQEDGKKGKRGGGKEEREGHWKTEDEKELVEAKEGRNGRQGRKLGRGGEERQITWMSKNVWENMLKTGRMWPRKGITRRKRREKPADSRKTDEG